MGSNLIVASLLAFGFWRIYPSLAVSVAAARASQPATPTGKNAPADFATPIAPSTSGVNLDAIARRLGPLAQLEQNKFLLKAVIDGYQ